eukprot:7992384-Karenia_brevis.AAC.1
MARSQEVYNIVRTSTLAMDTNKPNTNINQQCSSENHVDRPALAKPNMDNSAPDNSAGVTP